MGLIVLMRAPVGLKGAPIGLMRASVGLKGAPIGLMSPPICFNLAQMK